MEICGHTGREYDTNNPSMGCGGEIDLAEEDVMMVGAISFCVLCYENLSEADQEWVATEEETCQKCDEKVPLNPDNMWVQCTCSAHPGWYCGDHSPGNDCYSDEDCDCCNPEEPEETCVKCYTNEDVEQCSKCGKYTCVDCDGGDMGTYEEDGHTYCENCFPEEKVSKCSDCNVWVTATEECCGADLNEVLHEMKTLFEEYGLFASMMENYKETEGLGYWKLLEDSPYTNGEVLLDGWNSQDDFKRARGDWSYYETEFDECAQCHAKVVVVWVNKVGFTIGDCEGCGLMLCRKCLDNCQTCANRPKNNQISKIGLKAKFG